MHVIIVQFCFWVEALDTCKELGDQSIHRMNYVSFEIVEIIHVAHLRYAQPDTDPNG